MVKRWIASSSRRRGEAPISPRILAAQMGTPIAGLLVPISGVLALAGGLSIAFGYQARWGAWMLVAFLIPVTLMMRAFWKVQDPAAAHTQQAMFAKNLSMLGAALLIAYFGSGPCEW
jgi:putative oxidoreductase